VTLLFNCEGKDSFTPRNSSHQNINEQRSLELGFWDLQFSNVVRGLSLVLHDPEGSHYKNLMGLINQATTKTLVGDNKLI
jgi:hypothetical protein